MNKVSTLVEIERDMERLDLSKGKDYITWERGTWRLSKEEKEYLRKKGYILEFTQVRWVREGIWQTGHRLHVTKRC